VTSPRDELVRIAALPDDQVDLAAAALWIAAEECPRLDVPAYLARLDEMAAALAPSWPATADVAARVARLNRFLFAEQGFRGNAADYYDPRNSYLNEVLDRRLGIPITLSIVYIAVGRRLDLDVRGICFPGHFLVKCPGPDGGQVVVDAFLGTALSPAACSRRLAAAAGRPTALDPAVHLRSAAPREILVRVLGNLKQIFLTRGDLVGALACSERILLLTPDEPLERRDRDALRARVRLH
jgi:regulator of sirC expression with transglutaminase-like and TPR domain